MDNIEHLKQIHESFKNDETIVFEKIRNPDNAYFFVPSLEGTNMINALYEMYIVQNYKKAKASFYKAARVAEYMSNTYDRRVMDTGTFQFSYALFSDHKPLIKRYTELKNKINNTTSIGYQVPDAMKNVLLEDWDKLDWNIRCLERFVKVPKFKWSAGVVDVFTGFKKKDEELIKKGLEELLFTHKKRNTDPLICKFFSIDTAGFNKLAWIKGYEINLYNSLVPQELMPVKPLEVYTDYDFLKN